MRLRCLLARAVTRTAMALMSLALPLALCAQATRLLPLLVAAAPAYRASAVLAAGATALVAITLGPPILAVSVSLTLARLAAEGGVRALATHGVSAGALVDALRPVALVTAAVILVAGVGAEPPIARVMRGAAGELGLRGLAGSLRHGGQVEPVPGTVLAAPRGASGPLYVAMVPPDGGATATITAAGFTLDAPAVGTAVRQGIALRDARGRFPGSPLGFQVTARRLRVMARPPGPPEEVMAGDLTVGLTATLPAPARRHALRALWGVLAYATTLWAAALALRPWRSPARGVALSAVLPVAAGVFIARVGAGVFARATTAGGIWAAAGGMAVVCVILAEMASRGVAGCSRRVL